MTDRYILLHMSERDFYSVCVCVCSACSAAFHSICQFVPDEYTFQPVEAHIRDLSSFSPTNG